MEPDTYFHPTEVRGPRPTPTIPATLPSLTPGVPACFSFQHRPHTSNVCDMVEPVLQGGAAATTLSDRIALRQALMHLNNRHKRGLPTDTTSGKTLDKNAASKTPAIGYAASSPDPTAYQRPPPLPAPAAQPRASSETRYYTLRAPRPRDQDPDSHRLQQVRAGLQAFFQGSSRREGGADGMGPSPLLDVLPLQMARRDAGDAPETQTTIFQIGPDSRHKRSDTYTLKKSEPDASGLAIRVSSVDSVLEELKAALTSGRNVMFGAPGMLAQNLDMSPICIF